MTIQCFKYTLLVSLCNEMHWKLQQMTLNNSLTHVTRRQASKENKSDDKTQSRKFHFINYIFAKGYNFSVLN